jgi:hypothetical protein
MENRKKILYLGFFCRSSLQGKRRIPAFQLKKRAS